MTGIERDDQRYNTSERTDPFDHHPLSFHAPVVHLTGFISRVEEDVTVRGTSHHHLLIDHLHVLSVEGMNALLIPKEIFCAIRYGDELGLVQPIPCLYQGAKIELKGEYIDANHAYPSVGNPGEPVLHFTHRPLGFVVYDGSRYE